MTDDPLDRLLTEARDTYRVPQAPPDLDALWGRIEAEHFDAPRALPAAPRRRGWLAPAAGIAATLLVGIGIGRVTAAPAPADLADAAGATAAPPAQAAPAVPVVAAADPLARVTYEYIARTTALLDSLPSSTRAASLRGDARFAADASQLLATTRLLLDSPAATDPKLRTLLEDLELVLAQVARLRTAPRADELTFIADAVTERDVVPRLRTVAASYTGGY